MLRNVSPLAPMVVLATLSAVPVVVASVLAAPVTLMVPPPVAVKAGDVAGVEVDAAGEVDGGAGVAR